MLNHSMERVDEELPYEYGIGVYGVLILGVIMIITGMNEFAKYLADGDAVSAAMGAACVVAGSASVWAALWIRRDVRRERDGVSP